MDAEKLFIAEGADYFGNRLIYKHKDVGYKSPNSPLSLTPEGQEIYEQLADITDVEAKPVKAKAAKKPVASEDTELDKLLGE